MAAALAAMAVFGVAGPVHAADKKPASAEASAGKPNILFILVDNLGDGEIGAYGGGITRGAPTPRIDKLASEGLRLTNMNMETQCTPSRSSLMTGRFAIRSGTYLEGHLPVREEVGRVRESRESSAEPPAGWM
jgi:arylsulfatase